MSDSKVDRDTDDWRLARTLAVEVVKEGDFALAGISDDSLLLVNRRQALVFLPVAELNSATVQQQQALWKARLLSVDLGQLKSVLLLFCPCHSHPEAAALRQIRESTLWGGGVECDIVDPHGTWTPPRAIPDGSRRGLIRGLSRLRHGAAASTWELQQEWQGALESARALTARLDGVKPLGTYALLALCLGMFGWASLSGGSEDMVTMLRFGANYRPLTVGQGQWWRLVGAMFLHAGWLHLVFNMLGLWSVGPTLEKVYGNWRFLSLYALSGLGGSLLSVWRGDYVSVGASGALFGVFGAALVLGARHHEHWPFSLRRRLSAGMGPMIAFNLLYGLVNDGIDNAAHVGGLLVGLLFGWFVGPGSPDKPVAGARRWVVVVLGLSPFLVQLLAVQNALMVRRLEDFPTREYRNPWGSVTVTLPALFEPKRNEGEDFFAGPGFSVSVSEYEDTNMVVIDNPFFVNQIRTVEGQKSLSVTTGKVDGRTWLLHDAAVDGVLVFQGYAYIGEKAVKVEVGVAEGEKTLGRTLLREAIETARLRRHDRNASAKALFAKNLYRRSAEELAGQGETPDIMFRRAAALLETDAEEEGQALLEQVRKKEPDNAYLAHTEAYLSRRRKQYPKALAAFDALLSKAKSDKERGYVDRARMGLLVLLRREVEAKKLFARLSGEGDVRARSAVYNEMAWVLAMQGRYKEALPYAEKCVELLPDSNNLDTRGTVYYGLGRFEEAEVDFGEVLDHEINLGNANFYTAKLLERNDETRGDAVFFYYRYLLLDGPKSPHAEEARKALKDLGEGRVKL